MEKYVITLGDFLKNAGIVGFHYMLETAGAEKEVDFGYTDDNQAMWVSMDYAQNADDVCHICVKSMNFFEVSAIKRKN